MKHHLHLLLAAGFAALSIGVDAAVHDWTATRIGPFNTQGISVADINNAGQVAAWYAPTPFTQRGFLYTPGSSGGLVDLGSFGGSTTIPMALNSGGQVVGWSQTPDSFAHGFISKDGRIQRLSLPGELFGGASDINDRGQVLVNSRGADSITRDAIFHPAGPPTVLSVPAGDTATRGPAFQGINNRGQVFGSLASGGSYYYANGQWVDIGTLGGDAIALAMNESGTIVGTSNHRPFIYSHGQMRQIAIGSGDDHGVAFDINDHGQVVGVNFSSLGGGSEAFFYGDGQVQTLVDFGGGSTDAREVNELGQVVGFSAVSVTMGLPSDYHAFFYSSDDGRTTDVTRWLMNSFPDVALVERSGMALNDLGQFTVNALMTNGQRAIFVLTPIPEPSTYALMLVGLCTVVWIVRRQRAANARSDERGALSGGGKRPGLA